MSVLEGDVHVFEGGAGSNPSSSAILVEKAPNNGSFFVLSPLQTNTTEEEGFERARAFNTSPDLKHVHHPPKMSKNIVFGG